MTKHVEIMKKLMNPDLSKKRRQELVKEMNAALEPFLAKNFDDVLVHRVVDGKYEKTTLGNIKKNKI